MSTKTLSALVAAFASLAFVAPAAAQTRTWNFGDTAASPAGSCAGGSSATSTNYVATSGPTGTTTASLGNFWNCSQQGVGGATTLSAQAYSTTHNSSGNQVALGSTGTHFATASVNYHGSGSGIGVANRVEVTHNLTGEPNHALDNSTPGIDLLQLNFTSAQVLKSVKLGWAGDDGDFQLLAWTGSGAATSIVGKTAEQLVASGGGWSLVATVDGTGVNGVEYKAGTDWTTNLNVSSSYWLISAFNSGFGGSAPTGGIDAMKVLSVGTDAPGAVPIPGTLALASLGMLMAVGARRRKIQQA
jgi:hypothetical protein